MVKILWVDDEVELLKPHVMFLKGKGYDVDTCNNGYDAIDMVRSMAYDLIILDEMMPRRLRQHVSLPPLCGRWDVWAERRSHPTAQRLSTP